jgi:hypothetical protein
MIFQATATVADVLLLYFTLAFVVSYFPRITQYTQHPSVRRQQVDNLRGFNFDLA